MRLNGFPGTVIVLTQNDEENIQYCLESVAGWAAKVFVVDSFSVDRTVQIAKACGAEVVQHEFLDLASQRNWALDNLQLEGEWVFSLDSDEVVTEQLKEEMEIALARATPEVAAFAVKQAFIFLGRYLKHAQGGPFLVRIFRIGRARWYCEGARDYCLVDGRVEKLHSLIRHEDRKGLSAWTDKHNRYASWEARLLAHSLTDTLDSRAAHSTRGGVWRLRVRQMVYNRLPPVARAFLYFFYRYVIRGGFLDGLAGFAYCFLQALWYPLLVDLKLIELRRKQHK